MNTKWIAFPKKSEESEYSIFLFPHSGAGASIFAPWGKCFKEKGFDFYPVQYPMRESRAKDTMPSSLTELAHSFVDEVYPLLTSKNYIMYGRCVGSLVAFEAARYAQEKYGAAPELFITASGASPEDMKAPKISPDADFEEWTQQFIRYGFIRSEDLENKTFVDFYLPVLKADYILQSEYEYTGGSKLPCPVLALYGSQDDRISKSALEKWKDYTDKECTLKAIEGGHFFETRENIAEICDIIKYQLATG